MIAALQVGFDANGIDCTDSYRHVKRQKHGGIQPSAPSAFDPCVLAIFTLIHKWQFCQKTGAKAPKPLTRRINPWSSQRCQSVLHAMNDDKLTTNP